MKIDRRHRERVDTLTPRERQVLQLIADGLEGHAIANVLGISYHTYRGYRDRILLTLQAHSISHAIALCIHAGVIE